jgi:choice-of-anchor C domain-containing protein
MKTIYFGLAAALAVPSAGYAAAFINGDFELGINPGAQLSTLAAGSTDITGWTVTGGPIDYISGYWEAGSGSRSLDLSALTAGGISQTFDTIAGELYSVDFLLAGNPVGGAGTRTVLVSATGNAAVEYGFDTTGTSTGDMGWEGRIYMFTATGASTTVSFASLNNNPYGPALDNVAVSLTAVPEPAIWAMMIGGLGLVGMQMRRRQTTVSFT